MGIVEGSIKRTCWRLWRGRTSITARYVTRDACVTWCDRDLSPSSFSLALRRAEAAEMDLRDVICSPCDLPSLHVRLPFISLFAGARVPDTGSCKGVCRLAGTCDGRGLYELAGCGGGEVCGRGMCC